jgi:hypothetical protein
MEQRTAEHQMTTLFKAWADLDIPPIIELLNINNQVVGALYLDKMRYKNFIISSTNNSEKYYLYMDGISIYFSFFQKINP